MLASRTLTTLHQGGLFPSRDYCWDQPKCHGKCCPVRRHKWGRSTYQEPCHPTQAKPHSPGRLCKPSPTELRSSTYFLAGPHRLDHGKHRLESKHHLCSARGKDHRDPLRRVPGHQPKNRRQPPPNAPQLTRDSHGQPRPCRGSGLARPRVLQRPGSPMHPWRAPSVPKVHFWPLPGRREGQEEHFHHTKFSFHGGKAVSSPLRPRVGGL